MRIEGLSFRKELVKTLRLIPKVVKEYFNPKDSSPLEELFDVGRYGRAQTFTQRTQLKHQIKTLKVSARRKHPELVVRTLRILNAPTPNKEDIEFVYNFAVEWAEGSVLGGKSIYTFNGILREFYMDFYEYYGLTFHLEVIDKKPTVGINVNTHLAVDKANVYLLKSVKAKNLTQQQLNTQYRKAYSWGGDVYDFDKYLIPTHIFEK